MIVSCGEALIDFLPDRNAAGELAFRPAPGGSPFNVAVALARLGAPAAFFGALSNDAFGVMLLNTLDANGVDTSFVEVTTRPSTLAFVMIADGEARYAFFGEGSAGRMLTEDDLTAFPKTVTALHFGSISLAEEPCGSAFEMLMQREQRDCVISLDPNIRPAQIKNRDGYIARLDRLAAMSDIIKLSADDLEWLMPGAGLADIAERWLPAGAGLIVLTRGAQGAEAQTLKISASVDGVTAQVVDTVGAGDTFTAALLAHLERTGRLTKAAVRELSQEELTDALRFAARAAAVTVARAGADPPRREEVT